MTFKIPKAALVIFLLLIHVQASKPVYADDQCLNSLVRLGLLASYLFAAANVALNCHKPGHHLEKDFFGCDTDGYSYFWSMQTLPYQVGSDGVCHREETPSHGPSRCENASDHEGHQLVCNRDNLGKVVVYEHYIYYDNCPST